VEPAPLANLPAIRRWGRFTAAAGERLQVYDWT
jgi:hypothetical protein